MGQPQNVPQIRIRELGLEQEPRDGGYVLYWMTAFRRPYDNFALQRAVEWAKGLGRPLVIFEALRTDYPWASERLHRFLLDGMEDNAAYFARRGHGVRYIGYVEPRLGAGKGLLAQLCKEACVLVGDDFPCFFLPRMQAAAAKKVSVKFEVVDSNGLYPMRATERVFSRAFSLRRHLQKELLAHLDCAPKRSAFRGVDLPGFSNSAKKHLSDVADNWSLSACTAQDTDLAELPIDHTVLGTDTRGGYRAAERRLKTFVEKDLERYDDERNHPDADASSRLSPYLHFGHIGAHRVWHALTDKESWSKARVQKRVTGQRDGFWGMSKSAEAFVDEFVTWRELGYNMCAHSKSYDSFSSLPDWAKQTLREHKDDERKYVYSLKEFEAAQTHDEIWNAAQRELVATGRLHNYMRMLWGKKILHWTNTPEYALKVMIELNNKYALDGRNPNSYSGIFWVLGRYDRAWGPERPVFGKVRYMTSESTRKKLKLKNYLARWGDGFEATQGELF